LVPLATPNHACSTALRAAAAEAAARLGEKDAQLTRTLSEKLESDTAASRTGRLLEAHMAAARVRVCVCWLLREQWRAVLWAALLTVGLQIQERKLQTDLAQVSRYALRRDAERDDAARYSNPFLSVVMCVSVCLCVLCYLPCANRCYHHPTAAAPARSRGTTR
jgi:hypothetical protein